jgi:hypothetical protein
VSDSKASVLHWRRSSEPEALRAFPQYSQANSGMKSQIIQISSSGMLRRVALVRTDSSEELSASSFRVTTIGELGTKLVLISNESTLRRNTTWRMNEALSYSETSVLTRVTRRNIP